MACTSYIAVGASEHVLSPIVLLLITRHRRLRYLGKVSYDLVLPDGVYCLGTSMKLPSPLHPSLHFIITLIALLAAISSIQV